MQSPKLIRNLAKYPERYVGLFRPTKPQAKLIQNLTQSHEIKFGDAFETLIEMYLRENLFDILDKNFTDENGKTLKVDQIFADQNHIYFVEQKVRDDHDSSKKRGQIDNFTKKMVVVKQLHGNSGKKIVGIIYFIDDSFTKNKKYYSQEIDKLSNQYNMDLYLLYGEKLFDQIGIGKIWKEISCYLQCWKKEIPEMPEINFDSKPEESCEKIKSMEISILRKLFDSELDEVLSVMFPTCATLKLLSEHFAQQYKTDGSEVFKKLHQQCEATIVRIKK